MNKSEVKLNTAKRGWKTKRLGTSELLLLTSSYDFFLYPTSFNSWAPGQFHFLHPASDSWLAVNQTLCNSNLPLNRQYSYSPTVLGRVGLDHECEAHAGNFSPRGQTNMRKLRLSLPNLRKIFNIVKFWRAYTLERDHYFKQQRKICSLLLRKTAILTIIILMRRVLGERVYNLI